jgi:hypothetical protein
MISKILFILFLLPSTLWASTLNINIKDVLDLASYKIVASKSIQLDDNQNKTFNFSLNSWTFNANNSYSIKVAGEIKKIDEGTFYVKFKKSLYQDGNLVKVLIDKNFMLDENNNKFSANDSFWDAEGLVLRQENTLQIK